MDQIDVVGLMGDSEEGYAEVVELLREVVTMRLAKFYGTEQQIPAEAAARAHSTAAQRLVQLVGAVETEIVRISG